MNDTLLIGNWALALALVVASVAMIVIVAGAMQRSARGQLKRVRADFRKAQRSRNKAAKTAEKLQRRMAKLGANADKVKPRLLQEAKDALQDARALEKIADDRVLVAGNHLRRVIHDEFSPAQQQKLRDRYMPDEERNKGPFSF